MRQLVALSYRVAAKQLGNERTASADNSGGKEVAFAEPEKRPRTTETVGSAASLHQASPFSPVAGLFCTPIATEGNDSQQHFFTQRSGASGSAASYDWSGETLQHLGVDVLTPAALPQCTPMTAAEPPSTQASAQPPHHMVTPHPQSATDMGFVETLADAAQMVQQGQGLTAYLQAAEHAAPREAHHVLSPPAQRPRRFQHQEKTFNKDHRKVLKELEESPQIVTRSRARSEETS
jgi:hypothetical protein